MRSPEAMKTATRMAMPVRDRIRIRVATIEDQVGR